MTLNLDHYAYSLFAVDAYRDFLNPPEKQDSYAPPPAEDHRGGLWDSPVRGTDGRLREGLSQLAEES